MLSSAIERIASRAQSCIAAPKPAATYNPPSRSVSHLDDCSGPLGFQTKRSKSSAKLPTPFTASMSALVLLLLYTKMFGVAFSEPYFFKRSSIVIRPPVISFHSPNSEPPSSSGARAPLLMVSSCRSVACPNTVWSIVLRKAQRDHPVTEAAPCKGLAQRSWQLSFWPLNTKKISCFYRYFF